MLVKAKLLDESSPEADKIRDAANLGVGPEIHLPTNDRVTKPIGNAVESVENTKREVKRQVIYPWFDINTWFRMARGW